MEQFASTVSQNSDNATQASTWRTLHIAGSGGKISDQMVATMDDISHSSKRMIEIQASSKVSHFKRIFWR
jgi:methyl-accepting chemotaxis protein